MKIGVVFPQTEFPADASAVRDYTQTVAELGFSHVLAYDHILGANPKRPGGWKGPYTYQDPFLEPFLLFSFMAGISTQLEFATGIIILPQRETALVAKQAATLDRLCNGRLRMGIGVGWNKIEYIAQGQDFHKRGRRAEAQIALLKRLWTEPLVTVKDEWHDIPDAGLNPLPIQQPIPLWMGGHADVVLARIARMGDGWLPGFRQAAQAQPLLDKLAALVAENGRSWDEIGIEPRLHFADGNPDHWQKTAAGWRIAGATHLSVNTMGAGFTTAQQHLDGLQQLAEVLL